MKKGLLLLGAFAAFVSYAQDCQKLFISEYVEGGGNNKALEIYNPTASTINLSEYFVARLNNGATVGSLSPQACVQLTGTIAPYSTHVGVIDKRDPNGTGQEAPIWDELEEKADAFYCPNYNTSYAWYWNGNDCIMLAKGSASNPTAAGTELVDFFGKEAQDPENVTMGTNGWSSVAPYNMTAAQGGNTMDKVVTENHTMIRKQTVLKGKNSVTEVFAPGYTFNPLLEYDSLPWIIVKLDPVTGDTLFQSDGVTPQWTGNWASLGSHACNCDPSASVAVATLEEVVIAPNPNNGTFVVKGAEGVATIAVFNSLGQEVMTIHNHSKPSVSVSLEAKTGLYFVKLTDKNGTVSTKRLIVK